MSSLDVSRIVDVQISVSPLALQRAGYGILNIVGNSDIIPIGQRVREYNSITGVAEDFASTTEEYKAASIFFSQSPRPTTLYISRRAVEALPGILSGGTTNVAAVKAAGTLTMGVYVDGVDLGTNGFSMGAINSVSDIVDQLNTEFTAEGWELVASLNNAGDGIVVQNSDSTGVGSTVSYFYSTGNDADLIGLSDSTAAFNYEGVDGETISESLDAIENVNSKWYGFSFTKEVRDDSQTFEGTIDDCLDAAAWAEARAKTFWNNSSDSLTLIQGNTANISYKLNQLEYSRTATVYSESDYPAVSLMARGATVDFDGTDTTITYMFKQLPGIVVSGLSATQASAAESVNCNYYAPFGTQSSGDSVSLLANGVMSNGRFIDEVVSIDWLQNALQTAAFRYLFQNTTKVPQTDASVAGIEQVLDGVLAQAVNNGLAAAGSVTVGTETVFLPKGYEIFTGLVEDQPQSDREARQAPPIQFVIKGAGAIHGVTISGTFTR